MVTSSRGDMLRLVGAGSATARTSRRCSGADAIAVGRPVWWALTLGGAGGVSGLLDYLHRELVNTMLHLGVDKVASLGREQVQQVGG